MLFRRLLIATVAITSLTSKAADADWQCIDTEVDGSISRSCKIKNHTPPSSQNTAPISILETKSADDRLETTSQKKPSSNQKSISQKRPVKHSVSTANKTTDQTAATSKPSTASKTLDPDATLDFAFTCSNSNDQQVEQPGTSLIDLKHLPIETNADEAYVDKDIARFEGNAVFNAGDIELRADEAAYHRDTQFVQLNGNISILNSEILITGDKASINLNDGLSHIGNAHYLLVKQNIRGSADSVQIDGKDKVTIKNGSYTRCGEQDKVWEVKARNISLNQSSGQGKTKHAWLKIYDTPVLYLPYAQFPIGDKRQSGFLFPKMADTNTGFDFAAPYYFNIAPNIDATLSPRYIDNNGYLTEGEARWLNRFDRWSVSGSYIDNDKSFNNQSRWLVKIKEQGKLSSNITTNISYTDISDTDYLRDLNSTSLSANRATQLAQTANIRYADLQWTAGISVQKYQSTDNTADNLEQPYEKLPEFWLSYQSSNPNFTLGSQLDLRYSTFDHPALTDGSRTYGQFTLDYPMQWQGIKLTPTAGIEQLFYDIDARQSSTSTTAINEKSELAIAAPFGTLDLRTTFEKRQNKNNHSQIHTIEPRLFYLYRQVSDGRSDQLLTPAFDSDFLTVNKNQLLRRSRFGGYDVLEETNQLAASITHNRFDADGFKQLSATMGQIVYFQNLDDPDTLFSGTNASTATSNSAQSRPRSSEFITELEFWPSRRWQTQSALLWNTEKDLINQGSINIRYRHQKAVKNRGSILNLGYNFRRKDSRFSQLQNNIEQAEISGVGFIGKHWGLTAKYQYDLENDRRSESLAGLEYDDCCIKLRLVFRDGVIYEPDNLIGKEERDRSLFFQIELKGLMGIGRTLENVLSESIFGYTH